MYSEKCVFIHRNTFEVMEVIPENEKYQDYFEVDPLIAPGVSLLNKKGYITQICCQGHVPRMSCGSLLESLQPGYIAFSEEVSLPSIPSFYYPFMASVGTFHNCIVSDIELFYSMHGFPSSEEDFKKRIVAQSQSFNEWAMKLPILKRESSKRL